MATKFLEPGGDADFLVGTTNGFWNSIAGTPAVATDFVNGSHLRSIKYRPANGDVVRTIDGSFAPAGGRYSLYVYFVAIPTTATTGVVAITTSGGALSILNLKMTTAGVLQLWNRNVAQIGTDGPTLSTGQWYRISLAYTITSSTVNRIELFVGGVSAISITNATLDASATSVTNLIIGNLNTNAALDFRSSDHYCDDSTALTDPGNIWVTAKRPFSNGTTNNFTTQIGSGGSGYGSGHSPQVNERALSTTNGWSMVGAGSAVTEEYTIEGKAVGDINLTGSTIVDYGGWISQSAVVSETATMITGGTSSTYATGTAANVITSFKGSSTYPAGGTDIGVITSTDVTTFSLYECGILVAYIPPPSVKSYSALAFLGAG